MALNITATAQAASTPPRTQLSINAGASETLTEVTVKRDGKVIRSQPLVGGNTAVALDYEAPYGKPALYNVTAKIVGAYANEWSEAWANLSAWTGDTASFTTVSGEARSTVDAKSITRTSTAGIGRVAVGGTPRYVALQLLNGSGVEIARLEWVTGYFAVKLWVGATSVSAANADGPATVSISGGKITVRPAGGSWDPLSLPLTGDVRGVAVKSLFASAQNMTRIGAIAIAPDPAGAYFSLSRLVTLSPPASWLIHPTYPGLSVPFEGDCPISMNAETRQQVTSEAQRNVIKIQGSSTPVVVVNGRRAVDSWTLGLNCPTLEDRDQVRTLLDDQTPLLLRSHSTACDVPDGWYSVGDYGATRPAPVAANEYHRISLPMQPVREPAVAFGNAGWTYSGVALLGTYDAVMEKYATYLDLTLGENAA